MKLIGLAGGLATGKTTVANLISSKFSIPIINVDEVASAITSKDSPVIKEIVSIFGEEVADENGLNLFRLREAVSRHKDKGRSLEELIVSSISAVISENILTYEGEGHNKIFVESSTILTGNDGGKGYDEIVVVHCSEENQVRRLMLRDNITQDQARRIISAQEPFFKYLSAASFCIYNDDILELESKVEKIIKTLLGEENDA